MSFYNSQFPIAETSLGSSDFLIVDAVTTHLVRVYIMVC